MPILQTPETPEPLFQATARCRTNFIPGTLEPNRNNEFTLQYVSEPMPKPQAESLIAEWKSIVTSPDWEYEIRPSETDKTPC